MSQKISEYLEMKYGWAYGESGWNSGAASGSRTINWVALGY